MNEKISYSIKDTYQTAKTIAGEYPNALVLLNGQLGAGKTTFAKGYAEALGIRQNVYSPSYTLVNEYKNGLKCLYHIDLYRIESFEEVVDIGLFDILSRHCPCLIEWAERVKELNKLRHVLVRIEAPSDENEDLRIIKWRLNEGIK